MFLLSGLPLFPTGSEETLPQVASGWGTVFFALSLARSKSQTLLRTCYALQLRGLSRGSERVRERPALFKNFETRQGQEINHYGLSVGRSVGRSLDS